MLGSVAKAKNDDRACLVPVRSARMRGRGLRQEISFARGVSNGCLGGHDVVRRVQCQIRPDDAEEIAGDGSVCVWPRRRSRNRVAQSGLARPILGTRGTPGISHHHPHPLTPMRGINQYSYAHSRTPTHPRAHPIPCHTSTRHSSEPARRRPARLPPDPASRLHIPHPIRGGDWPVDR